MADFESLRPVYIVDGRRTPFLKAQGPRGPFSASDLATFAARQVMLGMPFGAEELDEVVVGSVMPDATEVNIARVISLRTGCGKKVPAYTVARNCASGMQALDCAAKDVAIGRAELVLAGGAESMSRFPLLFDHQLQDWFAKFSTLRTAGQRVGMLMKLRLKHLKPVIGVLQGLTDHYVGLNMGQTAENLAVRFGVSREEMDAFSLRSHQRLAEATDNGRLEEMVPIIGEKGNIYPADEGLRRDSAMEKLAKLKPVFDPKVGAVTGGNSSQITDGAAMLVLASGDAVKKYDLKPLGRLAAVQWAGLEPTEMGLGPVYSMALLLKRVGLTGADVDYWEINEAFAAQVLACLKAWHDPKFMRAEFGVDGLGQIPEERLNIDGGAISMGHPVGASGARITLHLLNVLKRTGKKRGVASLCIGGGQGGAVMVERTE